LEQSAEYPARKHRLSALLMRAAIPLIRVDPNIHPKPQKAAGPRISTTGKFNLFKKLRPRYFSQAKHRSGLQPWYAKPSRQYAP
jgi:hypothetical protein